MKKKGFYRSCIALILVLSMLLSYFSNIVSAASPDYIKEVRLSWDMKDGDKAENWLRDNGYTVVPGNLNAGTKKGYCYLGYKTTKNKDEAITDMAIISMDSGYKMYNYTKVIEEITESTNRLAAQMIVALGEFRENYKAGSPNAKMAVEVLNMIQVDENDATPLGIYLLHENRTQEDIYNILLMGNSMVVSLIYNEITLGVSDYKMVEIKVEKPDDETTSSESKTTSTESEASTATATTAATTEATTMTTDTTTSTTTMTPSEPEKITKAETWMVYYLFHIFGLVVAVVYMLCQLPKYEIHRPKGMLFFSFTYTTIYAVMILLHWAITGESGGQNVIRTFVFEPFIVWYYAKVFGLETDACMDLAAATSCISPAFGKLGCAIAGCCESWLQVPWGLYNEYTCTRLFPVQIAESLTAFGVGIFVHFMAKKHNYHNQGRCMPWMLILFGSTRVIWEFFRANEKIFLCFSELAIWSIAAVFLGTLWLVIDTLRKTKE